MIRFITAVMIGGAAIACSDASEDEHPQPDTEEKIYDPKVEDIQAKLNQADGNDVLVVVHRATCGDFPENSLPGIKKCIAMGVDMVELDVRRTKDNHLVLMHDATIDRTTSGTGNVSSLTLEEIKSYYLRDTQGILTRERVPTLAEALDAIKGKIMIRVDKAYSIINVVALVLRNKGMIQQATFVIPKENTLAKVRDDWGEYLPEIYLTPTLDADNPITNIVNDYQAHAKVAAFEMSFTYETTAALEDFKNIREGGSRVMVYTGSSSTCGGHDDKAAVADPAFSYGWLVDREVNMIQTRRPDLLLPYLREQNLHE